MGLRSAFILLLFSAFSLCASAGQTAEKNPVPATAFAKLPFMATPRLSPNGKYVAARLSVNRIQYTAIMTLNDPSAAPQIIAASDKEDDREIIGYRWVGDDWLVVSIFLKDEFVGQEAQITRLIAIERATGKVVPLAWDNALGSAADILWTSRDGKPRLLLERQSRAYGVEQLNWAEVVDVDVTTGRFKVIQPPRPNITSYFTDGDGVVRGGSGYDREKGRVTYLYRSTAGQPLKSLAEYKLEDDDTPPTPVMFTREPDKALVLDDKSGFVALYELDLTTMKTGKLLFDRTGYDIESIVRSEDQFGLDGVSVVEKGPRIIWINPEMKAIQKQLDDKVGAGLAHIASWSKDRTKMVVNVGGPSQAGAYFLYDTKSNTLQLIGHENEAFKLEPMNAVQTVRYPTRDGLQVPAVLTLPRHREAKNLPIVVMPHGGPSARDAEGFDWWAQAIAEQGYVVIQPNYRGSTGYGTKWEKMSENQWGLTMQDDLNDALTYLTEQGVGDPKRACIVGWSYGGYAAFRGAQRDGKIWRCAIAGAGVPDMPAMKRYDRNYLGKYGTKFIGSGADDLKSTSPQYFPQDFSTPILIVHGAKDQRVPVSQSRNMVKALRTAGKVENTDFRYVEQKENTHNMLREEDREQWITEVMAWLARWNPAG